MYRFCVKFLILSWPPLNPRHSKHVTHFDIVAGQFDDRIAGVCENRDHAALCVDVLNLASHALSSFPEISCPSRAIDPVPAWWVRYPTFARTQTPVYRPRRRTRMESYP